MVKAFVFLEVDVKNQIKRQNIHENIFVTYLFYLYPYSTVSIILHIVYKIYHVWLKAILYL